MTIDYKTKFMSETESSFARQREAISTQMHRKCATVNAPNKSSHFHINFRMLVLLKITTDSYSYQKVAEALGAKSESRTMGL